MVYSITNFYINLHYFLRVDHARPNNKFCEQALLPRIAALYELVFTRRQLLIVKSEAIEAYFCCNVTVAAVSLMLE